MPKGHAAVWLDHEHARIFALTRQGAAVWTVRPHERHVHPHGKAGAGDPEHAAADGHYFHSVAEALKDAGEVLIVGPGKAKHELMHHFSRHDPEVATKVVGVESMDHPSDGEIVKFARMYFRAVDRMR